MLECAILTVHELPRARLPSELLVQVAAEFPNCAIATTFEAQPHPKRVIHIDTAGWLRQSLYALDSEVTEAAESGPVALRIAVPHASDLSRAVLSVLTRYQRFIERRNCHSASSAFSRLLDEHRRLHALDKPLVRADYDHSRDTWHWLLRLHPDASMALQIAALFHDIERLLSEADRRLEQEASNYQAFKDAHAARGADLTRQILADLDFTTAVVEEAAQLITSHERPNDNEALRLLNDADALSFFSLNAMGFFDYFGFEHTQAKVAYSLGRLSPEGRARLSTLRLPPVIATFVAAELDGQEGPRSLG